MSQGAAVAAPAKKVWLLTADRYTENREVKLQSACSKLGATLTSFETSPDCKFYVRATVDAIDELAVEFEWIKKIYEINE